MRAPRSKAALALSVLGPLVIGLGCSEDTTTTTGVVHPTVIFVSPDDFSGSVACVETPGAMRSYVATFFDLGVGPLPTDGTGAGGAGGEGGGSDQGTGSGGKPIANVGPVDCAKAVGYGKVTIGNLYRAEILAFDRAGLEMAPSDSPLETPVVVDAETGDPVAPRWRATCGPATAREAVLRQLYNCTKLATGASVEPSVVTVSLDAARGTLECGSAPGQIDHYVVSGPEGQAVVDCGDTLTLTGQTGGHTLVLDVAAFEAGSTTQSWGTTCAADPPSGLSVEASCAPLTDLGALDVDPLEASTALGVECSELGALALSLEGGATQYVGPANCDAPITFTGLARGAQSVVARAYPPGDATPSSARCDGEVIPNQHVAATCRPEP